MAQDTAAEFCCQICLQRAPVQPVTRDPGETGDQLRRLPTRHTYLHELGDRRQCSPLVRFPGVARLCGPEDERDLALRGLTEPLRELDGRPAHHLLEPLRELAADGDLQAGR